MKSRRNIDISGEIEEAAVCRLCHDIAEDAIQSKCRHVFDRACVTQYIEASVDDRVYILALIYHHLTLTL